MRQDELGSKHKGYFITFYKFCITDTNNQEVLRLAVYPVESINTIKYRIVCGADTLNLAFDLIEVVEINLLYKELKQERTTQGYDIVISKETVLSSNCVDMIKGLGI